MRTIDVKLALKKGLVNQISGDALITEKEGGLRSLLLQIEWVDITGPEEHFLFKKEDKEWKISITDAKAHPPEDKLLLFLTQLIVSIIIPAVDTMEKKSLEIGIYVPEITTDITDAKVSDEILELLFK